MEHHAEVLTEDTWYRRVPDWRDFCAIILVLALLLLVASGAHEMVTPFAVEHQPEISLAPTALPYYALRTTMRMLAALVASLIFTFTYATLAAKSRRAKMVLIPLLDVLQSVPILGYLSFTVVFFVSLDQADQRRGVVLRGAARWPRRRVPDFCLVFPGSPYYRTSKLALTRWV